MSETQQTPTPADVAAASGETQDQKGEQQEQTFTQADVDRILTDRLKREREKFADYDALKAQAEGAKTAEDRLGDLEKQLEQSRREALLRRVQAAHGIADEDADLFLTGSDEETLTAQAKRLAERESERKKRSNHVPNEGSNPQPPSDDRRAFVRRLTGRD